MCTFEALSCLIRHMAVSSRHRRFVPVLLAVTIGTGAVVAGSSRSGPLPDEPAAIRHVLDRLAFGARPGDIDRVRTMGLDVYIERQLHPEQIDDGALEARLVGFGTLTLSSSELTEQYFAPALELRRQQQQARANAPSPDGPGRPDAPQTDSASAQAQRMAVQGARLVTSELMQAKVLRASLSERQLQEVLTDFWFNHFNVFVGKNLVRQYLTEYERDVIRPHVLGSFRDLLGAVAHSPAMLIYLDNWQSAAPFERSPMADLQSRLNDPRLSPAARQRLTERLNQVRQARPTRGLNENYARELLELHTLGVDGGYGQDDVVALARILTGWTVDQPRRGGGFVFRPATHDNGTKTLLGQTFAPTGETEAEFALDLLANHPSTARHIASKLVQRFVADEPPPSLVDRAAQTFSDTQGDLREVVRTIVTSPEFFSADARRAKVKTPLEFVISALRATDATVVDARPVVAALQGLGMPLYGSQPPTGYGMVAADWVNTGALLARMNFAVDMVAGGRGLLAAGGRQGGDAAQARRISQPGRPGGQPIRIDVGSLVPGVDEVGRSAVTNAILGGTSSDTTAAALARAETRQQLLALALGSPEFQRR